MMIMMMTTPASTDPIIPPLGEVLSILVLFFSSFFSLARFDFNHCLSCLP